MAGFNNLREYAQAINDGKTYYSTFRKQVNTTPANWEDVSTFGGDPKPIFFASTPMVAQPLAYSVNGGINAGPPVSPSNKYLHRFLICADRPSQAAMGWLLCDYLLYYPFIDMGSNQEQFFDNTLSLARSASGEGVQIIIVCQASYSITGQSIQMKYTNSKGVSGRLTAPFYTYYNSGIGSVQFVQQTSGNNSAAPFATLQAGDTGVRSVQSITFSNGLSDGLLCLILAKPVLSGTLLEQTAPSEVVPICDNSAIPKIEDNACLAFLLRNASPQYGIQYIGEIETVIG
jgi:hypothetical protein